MASRKRNNNLTREVVGIVLIGFCVFMTCCLVSYHPDDPSFATGYATIPETISNWGGLIGSYMSGGLFQVLGIGAYALPLSLLLLSVKLLFRPAFAYLFYVRTGLYLLFFICLEICLSLYAGVLPFSRYNFDAGGLLGLVISGVLTRYLNTFGTGLLLLLTVLLIIMGLTRVSYVRLWGAFWGRVASWFQIPVRSAVSWSRGLVSRCLSGIRNTSSRRSFEKKKKDTLGSGPKAPADEPARAPEESTTDDFTPETIPINVYYESEAGGVTAARSKSTVRYSLPGLSLLDAPPQSSIDFDREALREDADTLLQKLADFGVGGRIVEINPGPVITRFEFEPAPGIKLNRIIGLSDDLALALKSVSVRIAPIPGKSVVGIELPSKKRKTVSFKEIVSREEFQDSRSVLTIGLGKDIAGGTVINDLAHMPHLLVAGTTGSGKSVFVNTVICSILYKATPDEVRFLMVDPKRLELFPYDGIPHLLHPVVVDPKKAAAALRWAVEEMERRYKMIADKGTRNIVQYNKKIKKELENGAEPSEECRKMTYIVVVIDELADLMMIAARDVEGYIARLAQMARASGIHLLIATQRPSVDILTGVIKANFSSRISFKVSSKVDSRTILDTMGAEKLLGMGDMLFIPPGTTRLQRIHGAYISEKEIHRITEFIKQQGQPSYDESIVSVEESEAVADEEEEYDELYDRAVALVADTRQASISMLQRKMRVGYNRAARMIERMEKEGVVGPSDGVKPRDVLVNKL